MQLGALHPYERSLTHSGPLNLLHDDGRIVSLDIARWLAPADATDLTVLARSTAPVLDVGCGPGRMLTAMSEHGLLGLGIDIAATAVTMNRRRGLNCLRRSVFSRLPAEGRWSTVLLLDGNIGIGGDPESLLVRARSLISRTGTIIVETHPDPAVDERGTARFLTADEPEGPPFEWAYVGADAVIRYAVGVGLTLEDTWTSDGRTFVVLSRSSNLLPL